MRKNTASRKEPYKGKKTQKKGLSRWFKEKWVNQRGEVGYKYKNDIYRPEKKITRKTPKTHGELTKRGNKESKNKKIQERKSRQVLNLFLFGTHYGLLQ